MKKSWKVKNWLVVSIPLKNISQLELWFPLYGKIKNVPNHQPENQHLAISWHQHLTSSILPSGPFTLEGLRRWSCNISVLSPGAQLPMDPKDPQLWSDLQIPSSTSVILDRHNTIIIPFIIPIQIRDIGSSENRAPQNHFFYNQVPNQNWICVVSISCLHTPESITWISF